LQVEAGTCRIPPHARAVRQPALHGHSDLRYRVPGSIIRSDLPALSKLASHIFQELVALLGQECCCGCSESREFSVVEAED
jgi:hypothetical protein